MSGASAETSPVRSGRVSAGSPLRLPTVVVGGLGGSGTRLVAALLRDAGLHIGHDVNESNDNLWATLLFKHASIVDAGAGEIDARLALLAQATLGGGPASDAQRGMLAVLTGADRPQHPQDWLQVRASSLLAACERNSGVGVWGWKEPNSHMLLPHLDRWGVRYIHVVRDGLSMAGSRNRNQHAYWAEALACLAPEPTARYALRFWCATQRRAADFARSMGARFLMLDYEALCADPVRGIAQLNAFLAPAGLAIPVSAASQVSPPVERSEPAADMLDADDLAYALAWRHGVR